MTDWKALCRELVTAVESNCKEHIISHDLNCAYMKADAALAQPEPQGPTDEELGKLLYYEFTTSTGHGERVDAMGFARAVLARWGRPAIEPMPLSERLPGPDDCGAEGECWWWHPDHKEDEFTEGWMSLDPKWADGHHDADDSPVYTHWLPHHALPVPQQEVQ